VIDRIDGITTAIDAISTRIDEELQPPQPTG